MRVRRREGKGGRRGVVTGRRARAKTDGAGSEEVREGGRRERGWRERERELRERERVTPAR